MLDRWNVELAPPRIVYIIEAQDAYWLRLVGLQKHGMMEASICEQLGPERLALHVHNVLYHARPFWRSHRVPYMFQLLPFSFVCLDVLCLHGVVGRWLPGEDLRQGE